MELFHDRRPKPAPAIPLTKKQKALAQQYNLGPLTDKGALALGPSEQRAALDAADVMALRSQEWDSTRRGDLASVKNLHTKVLSAVAEARPDSCPRCSSQGCATCRGTGKRLW